MLEAVGIISSRFESAKSYLEWGQSLKEPVVGCIVVIGRDGGGHVAFCVGQDSWGNLLLLGLSGGLAGLGVLLMLNGYSLAVSLPLLG